MALVIPCRFVYLTLQHGVIMANRCFPPKMKSATVQRIVTIDKALVMKVPNIKRTFGKFKRSRGSQSKSVNHAFRTPSLGDMICASKYRRNLDHLS
jgi:hypothetical protein